MTSKPTSSCRWRISRRRMNVFSTMSASAPSSKSNGCKSSGVDGDVAHRLGHNPVHVDRLTGEQVHLPQEAARALPGDLVSGSVQDRRLALEDDDERVARVADAEQELSLCCCALLAARREHLPLAGGKNGAEWTSHRGEGTAGPAGFCSSSCGSAGQDGRVRTPIST